MSWILPSQQVSETYLLDLIKSSTRPAVIILLCGSDQQRQALADRWNADLNQTAPCASTLLDVSSELKVFKRKFKSADFVIMRLGCSGNRMRRIPIKWLRSVGVQTIVTVLLDTDWQISIEEELAQGINLATLDATRAFNRTSKLLLCLGPSDVGGTDFLVQLGS